MIYGRKMSEKEIEIWMRIFINTDPKILSESLETITKEAERMPTPGALTKTIRIVREKNAALAEGVRDCKCSDCHGSGYRIIPGEPPYKYAAKCPCHSSHVSVPHQYRDATDGDEVPCRVDQWTGEILYTATSCPEGRSFLAFLQEAGESKSISTEKRGFQPGTMDCRDCGQRYTTQEFMQHICPNKEAQERRSAMRRSAAK